MATPGFEYNIKDNYTVTLLNKVGAEDRGSVEVTTGTIYTVNSIPDHNGKYTLKEILEYAELNSYDVVTINIDYTFKECWFQIPENITLQAADGKTVKIELTNFEQAYYTSGASDYPIKTPIDSAGFYNYPRAAQINSTVMRLNSNNKFDNYSVAPTGERIIAMARRYWQLSPKGDCIVTNDGGFGANNQADYMNEDTVKITGITDVETENPRIEKSNGDPMGFSDFILIQTTTSYILKYSKTLTAIDGSVNIKTDGSQNFSGVEGWDIQSDLGGLYLATQDFLHLSYGKDENGDNISFVYIVDSSGALSGLFQSANFVKKFYTKLITCESFSYYILNPDGSKTTLIHYFAGGSQIWHYNGTDWTLEQYTGIKNPTHALFFGTRKEYATTETRIIYYIVSDANKGLTEIWKRKDGKWTLTGKFSDKSYIPLITYYDGISDPENPVLKILFKDALTHNLYYYTNIQYTLSKGSRLNGVTIENKDAFTDLGQNNSDEDIYIRSMIKGADTGNIQDQLITYCTINAEDYNAVYSIWNIQNSIIKSDKNAMYYKGSYQPYFTGECRHNLIQANNWAVNLEKDDDGIIYFGSVPLLHFKGADNTGDVIAVKNEGAMHKALKCYGVEGSSTTKISGAKSLYFNSADSDYAETQDKVDLNGDWTISFWVYYPTQTANEIITTAKKSRNFTLYFGSSGNMELSFNDGTGSPVYIISDIITQNEWLNVVIMKEGNVISLYVNNTVEGSNSTTHTFTISVLLLGATYRSTTKIYDSFSTIRIQDFRFYPYALSSTERNTIYNSGNGTFNNFALNTYFRNNTIYSLNGISANSTLSGMFYGCIIDAKFNALYRNAEAKHGFDISESLINGNTNDVTVNSDCIIDANPLFKSIQNGNFRLMSKAEGYPKDSKALLLVYNMTYGRYEDAGCYFVDYDNTGEDVDSFTLDNYIVDIGLSWEYPKKETIFDYKGNLVKNMGDRTRVISLLSQHGGIKLPVISMMEKLISINDTLRFYPFGGDGIPYMIDDSDESYIQIGELYFANSNISNGVLEVTTNTGYSLESGKWRGAWLSCVIGQFYIIDNDSDRMYLKVASDFSISPFADEEYLDCKVLYYYVKTADTIEYLNNIWYDKAQNGKFPTVKLYVVDSKEG